jgi:Domain of unknown function (DUF4386)
MNTSNPSMPLQHEVHDRHVGRSRSLAVGLMLLALLSFAPMAILGPAIGWPASLRLPAATQLLAIGKAPEAVAWGYAVYLLYSVLIAPLFIALAARVCVDAQGRWGAAAQMVVAWLAMSVLARCIGILRWLTVMPQLAKQHAQGDATTQAVTERVFAALNTYGGGIGELLGVSLFMALAVATLCVAAWRQQRMPTALAAAGGVVALLLLGMLWRVPVAAAVTGLTLWTMALSVWLWRLR